MMMHDSTLRGAHAVIDERFGEAFLQGLRAVCLSCGHTFEVPNIRFSSGTVILAANATHSTKCRKCGQEARIPAGTYTVINDALHHLEGQIFKRVQVDRLRAYRDTLLAQGRQASETIPDDVISAVSSISPVVGASIKLLKDGKGNWILLILLLHFILSRCEGGEGGSFVTINNDRRTEVVHNHNVTNVTNIYSLKPPTVSNDRQAGSGMDGECLRPSGKGSVPNEE